MTGPAAFLAGGIADLDRMGSPSCKDSDPSSAVAESSTPFWNKRKRDDSDSS